MQSASGGYRCLYRSGEIGARSTINALPTSPRSFHRRLGGGTETRLVHAPQVANRLGVGDVYIKDESTRLGTNAFKVLGASWATFQTLSDRLGAPPPSDWQSAADLANHFAPLGDITFVAATDGNHGHALAHIATRFGFRSRILLPASAPAARVERIRREGAEVVLVEGTYDDAVVEASASPSDHEILLPDTAWPGYEEMAILVGDGYGTLFAEIDEQLPDPLGPQDLVAVQIGVGTFASTAVRHFWSRAARPVLVGVESTSSACVMTSIAAGQLIGLPLLHGSSMDCLDAGRPSTTALPLLRAGIELFVAITDAFAEEAVLLMAQSGVMASPTGASGLGGLLALMETPYRSAMVGTKRVVLINTEGPVRAVDDGRPHAKAAAGHDGLDVGLPASDA